MAVMSAVDPLAHSRGSFVEYAPVIEVRGTAKYHESAGAEMKKVRITAFFAKLVIHASCATLFVTASSPSSVKPGVDGFRPAVARPSRRIGDEGTLARNEVYAPGAEYLKARMSTSEARLERMGVRRRAKTTRWRGKRNMYELRGVGIGCQLEQGLAA